MNGNEQDRVLSGEEAMRAKLCAVILGEASDAERVEVEAALANSAELRDERARLEATIGLVAMALKEDGGAASELPPQAQAALSAAAAKRAQPTWYRTNGFRIAASFIAFASIVAALRAILSQSEATPSSNAEIVASALGKKSEVAKEARAAEGEKKAPSDAPAATELSVADSSTTVATVAPAEQAPAADAKAQWRGLTGGDIAKLDDGTRDTVALSFDSGVAPAKPAGGEQLGLEARRGLPEAHEALKSANEPHADVERSLQSLGYSGGSAPVSGGGGGGNSVVTKAKDGSPSYGAPTGAAAPSSPGSPGPATGGSVSRLAASSGGKRSGSPGGGTYKGPGDSAAPAAPALRAAGEKSGKDGEGKVRLLKEVGYSSEDNDEISGSDDFYLGKGDGTRGVPASGMFPPDWHTRFERMQRMCYPRPDEKPRDMFFRFWGDNPFEVTAFDRLSTFSVDVDTASYTLARNLLVNGHLPPKEAIRTEEFVNYFKGDVPAPREGTFNVATELAPNMFGDSPDSWMLRVALRGREVQKNERMPLALTFIIDVSGSMKENNRLELVKHALRLLVTQLDARDSISLVKFSTDAGLVLPMTSARQRDLFESAIDPLQPEGSTNTEAGLRMGYAQAVAGLSQGANNRVVLLTDGVANVGITDPNALVAMVENQRKAGIYLNTVGVGMNNHNDNLLEQLADKGDGMCNYVDDAKEVRRALVDNFTGAFETIARDVKIQVEFDPAQVERYRLLGYENRAVADADFRNDKVDAGEVGAGHQVVALYEVMRTHAAGDGPLATVHVRWKAPYKNGVADSESDGATEIAQPVLAKNAAGSFSATSAGYRRSILVAQFAEFLRRSIHARNDSVDQLIESARKLSGELKDTEFDEFVDLTVKSRELVLAELAHRDWFDRCGDELRQRCYLQAQIDDMQRRLGRERKLEEMERDSADLQRQLDALRAHLESLQGQGDEDTLVRLQRENIELQRRLIDLFNSQRAGERK